MPSSSIAATRPDNFNMIIHSGMLETMGHNMYSSVAKCLAEFVANSYDADAQLVDIEMDFSAITKEKEIIRNNAKEEKKKGLRKDISAVYDPLPEYVSITISDDGHGMSPSEIQNYFMAVTRNRRKDLQTGEQTKVFTESGNRRVMGRKGVGKLAGFGVAEHVKVKSKRKGQNFATLFEMDYGEIKDTNDLSNKKFKATYIEKLNTESQYTKITLSKLRCDSMKSSKNSINRTLARTFLILDKNFKISINNEPVEEEIIEWEYTYPENATEESMGEAFVGYEKENKENNVDDIDTFPFKYLIRFRARPNDHDADEQKKKVRASLPAERRGARIYSHGRIAHGPSLLNLHSGVHNFHAQDYMECIVIADKIDEFEHDCIVTSREGLNKDNPIVRALFNTVTELMKESLKEHSKFRGQVIKKAIDEDPFSKNILSPLQSASKKTQASAKKILTVLGSEHGIKSDTYKEMAPIVLQAVNAGEVLSDLIRQETTPKSIPILAEAMAELSRIETRDLLKLYRGRSSAINTLRKLHNDSYDKQKGKGYENQLHDLLKENTWLIKPEFGSYLTSDKPMAHLCQTLDTELAIDQKSDLTADNAIENEEDKTRPDLVFVAANNNTHPDTIVIIELKSPGIKLNNTHLTQLKTYVSKTKRYLESKLQKEHNVNVHGYLIGTKPNSDTKSATQQLLQDEMKSFGPLSPFKVIDLIELINDALQVHQSGIEILEAEESRLEEDLS
ncbi:MAG: hypothetical protein DSZ27_04065 [Thiomicrospira sp.]|nr:MAG: hypothetical protein DSZ27_04065 [Thiomicrospira sp.]